MFKSKQRKALEKCVLEGLRGSLLQEIWRSDDLWTMREVVRRFPSLPRHYDQKFKNALKQSSG